MFIKEHIDLSRKRLSLSKEERDLLGGRVVVRRKGDSLILYSEEEWASLANEELSGLRGIKFRRAQRSLLRSGHFKKVRRDGRITIPYLLREEKRAR